MNIKTRNAIQALQCDLKQKLRELLGVRSTFGDRIIIKDEVFCYEGSAEDVKKGNAKLKFKSKGHIVNTGLMDLVSYLGASGHANWYSSPAYLWSAGDSVSKMRVGTGGGATTASTTGLTTENATATSSKSGATTNPVGGSYRVAWTATWNAGVLAAIDVSEIGLWLYIQAALTAFGAAKSPTGVIFFSRLSNDDGDFTTFTVNIAAPLTIEWRLTLSFA